MNNEGKDSEGGDGGEASTSAVLNIEWEHIDPIGDKLSLMNFIGEGKSSHFLILPPFTVQPNNDYSIELRVWNSADPTFVYKDNIHMTIVPSDLELRIAGGSLKT